MKGSHLTVLVYTGRVQFLMGLYQARRHSLLGWLVRKCRLLSPLHTG